MARGEELEIITCGPLLNFNNVGKKGLNPISGFPVMYGIYKFALVDPDPPTAIEIKPAPKSSIADPTPVVDPRKIILTHEKSFDYLFGLNGRFDVNTSFLLVCQQVYAEAIAVLYSSTEFLFYTTDLYPEDHDRCFGALICFGGRLGARAQACIQRVAIQCPRILRNNRRSSEFEGKWKDGLDVLKGFPTLRHFEIILDQDTLSRDIPALSQIQQTVPPACRIKIQLDRFEFYTPGGRSMSRAVRISGQVMTQMSAWNWNISGKKEIVSQGHEFADERVWMDSLEHSSLVERNVKAGRIDDDYDDSDSDSDSDFPCVWPFADDE
ncbi:MAG: hypothetical protein Q9168_005111 [Polycauliona sp. 1 TL-2023]